MKRLETVPSVTSLAITKGGKGQQIKVSERKASQQANQKKQLIQHQQNQLAQINQDLGSEFGLVESKNLNESQEIPPTSTTTDLNLNKVVTLDLDKEGRKISLLQYNSQPIIQRSPKVTQKRSTSFLKTQKGQENRASHPSSQITNKEHISQQRSSIENFPHSVQPLLYFLKTKGEKDKFRGVRVDLKKRENSNIKSMKSNSSTVGGGFQREIMTHSGQYYSKLHDYMQGAASSAKSSTQSHNSSILSKRNNNSSVRLVQNQKNEVVKSNKPEYRSNNFHNQTSSLVGSKNSDFKVDQKVPQTKKDFAPKQFIRYRNQHMQMRAQTQVRNQSKFQQQNNDNQTQRIIKLKQSTKMGLQTSQEVRRISQDQHITETKREQQIIFVGEKHGNSALNNDISMMNTNEFSSIDSLHNQRQIYPQQNRLRQISQSTMERGNFSQSRLESNFAHLQSSDLNISQESHSIMVDPYKQVLVPVNQTLATVGGSRAKAKAHPNQFIDNYFLRPAEQSGINKYVQKLAKERKRKQKDELRKNSLNKTFEKIKSDEHKIQQQSNFVNLGAKDVNNLVDSNLKSPLFRGGSIDTGNTPTLLDQLNNSNLQKYLLNSSVKADTMSSCESQPTTHRHMMKMATKQSKAFLLATKERSQSVAPFLFQNNPKIGRDQASKHQQNQPNRLQREIVQLDQKDSYLKTATPIKDHPNSTLNNPNFSSSQQNQIGIQIAKNNRSQSRKNSFGVDTGGGVQSKKVDQQDQMSIGIDAQDDMRMSLGSQQSPYPDSKEHTRSEFLQQSKLLSTTQQRSQYEQQASINLAATDQNQLSLQEQMIVGKRLMVPPPQSQQLKTNNLNQRNRQVLKRKNQLLEHQQQSHSVNQILLFGASGQVQNSDQQKIHHYVEEQEGSRNDYTSNNNSLVVKHQATANQFNESRVDHPNKFNRSKVLQQQQSSGRFGQYQRVGGAGLDYSGAVYITGGDIVGNQQIVASQQKRRIGTTNASNSLRQSREREQMEMRNSAIKGQQIHLGAKKQTTPIESSSQHEMHHNSKKKPKRMISVIKIGKNLMNNPQPLQQLKQPQISSHNFQRGGKTLQEQQMQMQWQSRQLNNELKRYDDKAKEIGNEQVSPANNNLLFRVASSGTAAINPENVESARIMSQTSIESSQNLPKNAVKNNNEYEVLVTLKGGIPQITKSQLNSLEKPSLSITKNRLSQLEKINIGQKNNQVYGIDMKALEVSQQKKSAFESSINQTPLLNKSQQDFNSSKRTAYLKTLQSNQFNQSFFQEIKPQMESTLGKTIYQPNLALTGNTNKNDQQKQGGVSIKSDKLAQKSERDSKVKEECQNEKVTPFEGQNVVEIEEENVEHEYQAILVGEETEKAQKATFSTVPEDEFNRMSEELIEIMSASQNVQHQTTFQSKVSGPLPQLYSLNNAYAENIGFSSFGMSKLKTTGLVDKKDQSAPNYESARLNNYNNNNRHTHNHDYSHLDKLNQGDDSGDYYEQNKNKQQESHSQTFAKRTESDPKLSEKECENEENRGSQLSLDKLEKNPYFIQQKEGPTADLLKNQVDNFQPLVADNSEQMSDKIKDNKKVKITKTQSQQEFMPMKQQNSDHLKNEESQPHPLMINPPLDSISPSILLEQKESGAGAGANFVNFLEAGNSTIVNNSVDSKSNQTPKNFAHNSLGLGYSNINEKSKRIVIAMKKSPLKQSNEFIQDQPFEFNQRNRITLEGQISRNDNFQSSQAAMTKQPPSSRINSLLLQKPQVFDQQQAQHQDSIVHKQEDMRQNFGVVQQSQETNPIQTPIGIVDISIGSSKLQKKNAIGSQDSNDNNVRRKEQIRLVVNSIDFQDNLPQIKRGKGASGDGEGLATNQQSEIYSSQKSFRQQTRDLQNSKEHLLIKLKQNINSKVNTSLQDKSVFSIGMRRNQTNIRLNKGLGGQVVHQQQRLEHRHQSQATRLGQDSRERISDTKKQNRSSLQQRHKKNQQYPIQGHKMSQNFKYLVSSSQNQGFGPNNRQKSSQFTSNENNPQLLKSSQKTNQILVSVTNQPSVQLLYAANSTQNSQQGNIHQYVSTRNSIDMTMKQSMVGNDLKEILADEKEQPSFGDQETNNIVNTAILVNEKQNQVRSDISFKEQNFKQDEESTVIESMSPYQKKLVQQYDSYHSQPQPNHNQNQKAAAYNSIDNSRLGLQQMSLNRNDNGQTSTSYSLENANLKHHSSPNTLLIGGSQNKSQFAQKTQALHINVQTVQQQSSAGDNSNNVSLAQMSFVTRENSATQLESNYGKQDAVTKQNQENNNVVPVYTPICKQVDIVSRPEIIVSKSPSKNHQFEIRQEGESRTNQEEIGVQMNQETLESKADLNENVNDFRPQAQNNALNVSKRPIRQIYSTRIKQINAIRTHVSKQRRRGI